MGLEAPRRCPSTPQDAHQSSRASSASEGTFEGRKILSPFDERECISLKEAADIAGKSESTLRAWCEDHGLGRRVGGGTWLALPVNPSRSYGRSDFLLHLFREGDDLLLTC